MKEEGKGRGQGVRVGVRKKKGGGETRHGT